MRAADINRRLASAGYTLSLTEKSRYLYHMTQRLIACEGWDALQTHAMARLWLNAGIRKGRAYTLSELRQIAQPREDDYAFTESMQRWVRGSIFKRCVRIRCEHCALEQTPLAPSLTDPMTCAGCQNPMPIPLDIQFAYLPNPLFCVGMVNGLLTVLRVLWRLAQETPEGVWVGGVLLEKTGGTQIEVDLLFLTHDALHVIEAKDALPDTASIQMQMLRYQKLSQEIDAICTLASLPPVPDELNEWCTGWGIGMMAG